MTNPASTTEPAPTTDPAPTTELPDLLTAVDGSAVDAGSWLSRRRPELLRLLADQVYGVTPAWGARPTAQLVDRDPEALDGLATRLEFACGLRPRLPVASLLVYLPNAATGPVPAFLGLNFRGNHTVDPDPAIPIAGALPRRTDGANAPGADAASWPLADIVGRGYALATCCADDIEPDVADGSRRIIGDHRADDGWGALGGWAWGLSRLLDVLIQQPGIDGSRVAVIGHSRMGKAALWAGAQDDRFALVVSNESGCGGAALSRRDVGESVEAITSRFPHWFSPGFTAYAGREHELAVDQHFLLAAIAPRPLYVASAADDLWSDPEGEWLGTVASGPAYRLLGAGGFDAGTPMPAVGESAVSGRVGYHIRPGEHAITADDWQRYLDFADHHLT